MNLLAYSRPREPRLESINPKVLIDECLELVAAAANETREVLRARAEEGREYVKTRAREAREQAAEWADKGRDVVTQQKEQFRAAYEAGRQAYHEATSETAAPKNL